MNYIYNDTEYSYEDIGRKFTNTWVILKEFGLVRIVEVHRENFFIEKDRHILQCLTPQFQIESDFPEVDIMVNYQKGCGLISRVPRRQNSVGLSKNVLSAVNPAGYAFYNGDRVVYEFANVLFFPTYIDIHKIYTAIMKDSSVALAFNENYWLCRDSSGVNLWRKAYKIGILVQISDKEYDLTLDDCCLSMEQELKDEIRHVKFNLIKSV